MSLYFLLPNSCGICAALDELTSTMLSAVAVKYKKNSTEYEKAGGTRTDERKSPMKKIKAATV